LEVTAAERQAVPTRNKLQDRAKNLFLECKGKRELSDELRRVFISFGFGAQILRGLRSGHLI
jgi:hypothetical protein